MSTLERGSVAVNAIQTETVDPRSCAPVVVTAVARRLDGSLESKRVVRRPLRAVGS